MVEVSVIVPTYNRRPYLAAALEALARQSLDAACFEVIVVDDGSTDDTATITRRDYPFALRYVAQANAGDAAARNTGARQSAASLLVFIDDDILVGPDYLAALVDAHAARPRSIIVGTEHLWRHEERPSVDPPAPSGPDRLQPLPFADMCSNNMSIARDGYLDLGLMQGLAFAGSSMWCDTEFAYRAYEGGYAFWRSERATCWHRDYTMRTLAAQARRAEESAFRAVALFQRHPGLLPHLPMFADKGPIDWPADSPTILARKLLRPVTASRPALALLGVLHGALPRSWLRRAAARNVVGGHIFRGYRRGLRELGGIAVGSRPGASHSNWETNDHKKRSGS